MPRKKAESVTLLILRDGVFIADDERRDKGERCTVASATADVLVRNGHAKPV